MSVSAASKFRTVFRVPNRDALRWYPSHMDKGMQQMQRKLKMLDCVIEVHDARIPLSGRNDNFKHTVSGIKPHILVLNKEDLIPREAIPRIAERLKPDVGNIVFTNCKDHTNRGIRKILPLVQNLIESSERFNRENSAEYNIMVIGVPNVGKSSLINKLRNLHLGKSNASSVGALPGITRSVLNRIKMCEKPLVYLYDTPGILTPSIPNSDAGLKAALCAILKDNLVGAQMVADYLLYWLNKNERFEYVEHCGLKEPTDNIMELLVAVAKKLNKSLKMKDVTGSYVVRPDLSAAAEYFLKCFRTLEFGPIMLDSDVMGLK